MERKYRLPALNWLSSRLNRKLGVIMVSLALLEWAVISLHFADYLERLYLSMEPVAATRYAALNILLFNLLVLAVGAVLLFLLMIRPLSRLRRDILEYYNSRRPLERTERSDEIGRLRNTFVDLTAAAEQADQAERRLIASISHDIKTPLTSVLGYSERLRSAELSQERRAQYVDLIHEKALRLKAVVDEFDDYLDVGLRDSAPMRLMTAEELCRRLQEEYGEELHDAGVSFQLQCHSPQAQFICNWEHMRRLFGNLISNSISHAQAPSLALTVQCRQVGNQLRISFRDNGVGVPPGLLGQIFEPLYTSDKGRKVSGLGLSICQSIVKAHGGSLHAENAPEGGLVVEMLLPCVEL